MSKKTDVKYTERQKKFILRALTEPVFRKQLKTDAKAALERDITPEIQKEVDLILAAVKGIEHQIGAMADNLLCIDGPCHIA